MNICGYRENNAFKNQSTCIYNSHNKNETSSRN